MHAQVWYIKAKRRGGISDEMAAAVIEQSNVEISFILQYYTLGPYKSPLLSSLTREKRSINLQGHKKENLESATYSRPGGICVD